MNKNNKFVCYNEHYIRLKKLKFLVRHAIISDNQRFNPFLHDLLIIVWHKEEIV